MSRARCWQGKKKHFHSLEKWERPSLNPKGARRNPEANLFQGRSLRTDLYVCSCQTSVWVGKEEKKKKKNRPYVTGVVLHSHLQSLSWKQERPHSADSGRYTPGRWGIIKRNIPMRHERREHRRDIQRKTHKDAHTPRAHRDARDPVPCSSQPRADHSRRLHLLAINTGPGSPLPCPS